MAAQQVDMRGVIRRSYCAECSFSDAVYVTEEFGDGHRLEELVLVFDLRLHQEAKQCFAWFDRETESLVTVLAKPPLDTPQRALCAHEARRAR